MADHHWVNDHIASYLAGGLPGLILSLGISAVFLYGGWRVVQGSLTLGTFAAFIAYQMRVMAPVQALNDDRAGRTLKRPCTSTTLGTSRGALEANGRPRAPRR